MAADMHLPSGHQVVRKQACAHAFSFSQRAPILRRCRNSVFHRVQTVLPDSRLRHLHELQVLHHHMSNSRAVLRCSAAGGTTLATLAEDLTTWMTQQGVALDKAAALPTMIDGELVLATSRAVTRGNALLTVADTAWITPETVARSQIGKALVGLEPWLQLALFLVAERANPNSQYRPYVEALPANPDLLTFWSDAELAELEGTQLLDSVEGYRAFFSARFQDLESSLFSSQRGLFPAEVFTYEAFLWAVSSVRARVHAPLEGEKVALVPGAELVRHQRGPGAQWKLDTGGLLKRGQAITLEAERDIAEGEVVTMDFNPAKLDGELLLDYGVWDAARAQGAFILTLTIPPNDPNFDDKADILDQTETFGATWEAGHKFRLMAGERTDPELLGFLRLVNLRGPDAFLLEALFRNNVWDFMLLPVSEDNERAVCLSMIDGCKEALRSYRTTLEEDLRLLPELQPGTRRDKAVRARLAEKEALDTTLRSFEERLRRLDELEYYQERRLRGLGLLDDDGKTTYDGFFKDGIA